MPGSLARWVLVVPPTAPDGGPSGEGVGVHGVVLLLLALVVAWRRARRRGHPPAVGRSLRRLATGAAVDRRLLAIEATGVAALAGGLAGTLLYGRVWAPCGATCDPGPVPPLAGPPPVGSPAVVGGVATGATALGLAALWAASAVARSRAAEAPRWRAE